MSASLRNKKILFNQLLELLHRADDLYIKFEGEWVRPQAFEKAALIISGFIAALPLVLEKMEQEISTEEEEQRMHKELELLIEEEKTKFNRLPKTPPSYKEDVDDEGGTFELGQ